FLIFGVLLGPVVGTAFGVLSYYFYGVFPLESLGEHWMSFFFGNSLGALVFAPFMVSVSKSWRDLKTLHPMRLLEATALAFSLFFITPWALANGKSFLLYPFITWAALRFTFVGVSASTLTISSFAMMTQKLVFDSPDFDILWIQSFILTITTSAYFLATL